MTSDHTGLTRRERRLTEREAAHGSADRRASLAAVARRRRTAETRTRGLVFGGIVVAVLGLGAVLAFGDFFGRTGGTAGEIDVQSSMAGFTPSDIRVTAGTTARISWWTDDAAIHLENGVYTMIAPDLGLYEELPAEGSRTITWQVPDRPGTYDVYCDTCCGGVDSPTMHGRIVIEPAAA